MIDTVYFISTRPQTSGIHIIHRACCPMLPEPGRRIFLGMNHSPRDAMEEGLKHFRKVKCCPFCLKQINETAMYLKKREFDRSELNVSYNNIIPSAESALMCCIN